MSEIDWSVLGPPVDVPGAVLQGYQTGRALKTQREQDSALHALSANPDDSAAQNALMAINPELAIHYQQASLARQDAARKGHAREAASDVIRAFGAPAAEAPSAFARPAAVASSFPAAQQNVARAAPLAGVPPPVDASLPGLGASPALAPAPAAAMPAPMPTGAPAAPQGLLDPSHPVTQAVGAAVSSQRMSQTDAVAELARYADPEQIQQVLGTIKAMDGMRLSQLSEANDAIGVAAQTLLGIPDDPGHAARRQALMAQADQLAQHGVTQEQLASADLSDAALHGRIGQAVGVKAMIEAAQKDREAAREDATLAETHRHNLQTEAPKFQSVAIHNADGSEKVVSFNPDTGRYEDTTGAPVSDAEVAGAGRRTHGYTPRRRDGGDNPDNVVDNKISALSRAVGVSPDAPMTPEQFVKFVQAIPATEGSGNNNPGGIKDGAYARSQPGYAGAVGQYAKFATREAGMAAMAQLLRHSYYDKGQQSIRDIIEGKPSGGATSNPVHGATSVSGNGGAGLSDDSARLAAAIYRTKGVLPTGIARTKGDVDKVLNFAGHMSIDEAHQIADQTVGTWQDTRAAQDTLVAFSKGKQADQTRSLNVAIHHIDLVRQAAAALQNGNIPLFNSIGQQIAQSTGHAAPTNFDALKQFVFDEVTKGAIGSSGALGDRQEASRSASRASSPQQLVGVLDNYQTLLGGQARGLQRQYEAGTGRHDYADKYLEPRTRQILLGQGAASHGIPTLTPEQVRAAAPGTMFHTTDGRIMRKK